MTAIRNALENAAGHLADHPDEATDLDTPATAILVDGLRCRVEGPSGELMTDMATSLGGGATAPSPGWLHARGAGVVRRHHRGDGGRACRASS